MIVITGGCGFIGSNIVEGLNDIGATDILVVDNATNGKKLLNLSDLQIADYMDKGEFLSICENGDDIGISAIIHQGACSATTTWDGRYVMENNFRYSKILLNYALERHLPFIYASSAAVYGSSIEFEETASNEGPINAYGYSKLCFDQYVRQLGAVESQVVGLRYFNVYGPREFHKGSMASVAYHLSTQIDENVSCKLFGSYNGIEAGKQKRDFVYVKDCVAIIRWFLDNKSISGIFNIGSGEARTFKDLADIVVKHKGRGTIEYIDFPEHLKNAYQSYTKAELGKLRAVGCDLKFTPIEIGVPSYLNWLSQNEKFSEA